MSKEPKAMKDIHDIRKRIYEETKNLSSKEFVAKIRHRAQALKEKYHLGFKEKIASA